MDAFLGLLTSLRSVDEDARAARTGEVSAAPNVGRILRPRVSLKLVQGVARFSQLLLKV